MSVIVHVIAIGITGLGLLLCIISISTKHWLESEGNTSIGKAESNSGLWEACVDNPFVSGCSSITIADGSDGDKFRATRAFTVMAILAFALAGLCLILTFIKKVFLLIFIFAIAGAAFCQLVGMSIYTDLFRDAADTDFANFGWSFALGWVGFILALASAIFGIALKLVSSD